MMQTILYEMSGAKFRVSRIPTGVSNRAFTSFTVQADDGYLSFYFRDKEGDLEAAQKLVGAAQELCTLIERGIYEGLTPEQKSQGLVDSIHGTA